jgi:hypothetical protein
MCWPDYHLYWYFFLWKYLFHLTFLLLLFSNRYFLNVWYFGSCFFEWAAAAPQKNARHSYLHSQKWEKPLKNFQATCVATKSDIYICYLSVCMEVDWVTTVVASYYCISRYRLFALLVVNASFLWKAIWNSLDILYVESNIWLHLKHNSFRALLSLDHSSSISTSTSNNSKTTTKQQQDRRR